MEQIFVFLARTSDEIVKVSYIKVEGLPVLMFSRFQIFTSLSPFAQIEFDQGKMSFFCYLRLLHLSLTFFLLFRRFPMLLSINIHVLYVYFIVKTPCRPNIQKLFLTEKAKAVKAKTTKALKKKKKTTPKRRKRKTCQIVKPIARGKE